MTSIGPAHVDQASAEVVCLGADAARLAAIAGALRQIDLSAVTCTQLDECVRLIAAQPAAVCVVDLGNQSALMTAIRTLRGRFPRLAVAAVCDAHRTEAATEARRAGAGDTATWPTSPRDLGLLVANVRERATPALSSSRVDTPNGPLIAQSPAMQQVVDLVAEAARGRAGVCVSGEPGSGRSLVASIIHHLSDDGGTRPCVVEDCGEETHDLERRLFGIVSTAPRAPQPASTTPEPIGGSSAVYRARGGTLLLRNIADAPARVQARLARLLRDREAVFVNGSRRVIEVDVQPIATLDSDVEAAVAEGRLRRDLFKQLAQIRIDVPALRRRREDIALLAYQFLREDCDARHAPVKGFSRATLQVMSAMRWPGNAAELRALMKTLAGAVEGPIIHLEHLLSHVSLDGLGEPVDAGATLRDARARFERDCISAVLIRHRGRVPEAAKALGIQRTNLYRKIRQLNVSRALLSARR